MDTRFLAALVALPFLFLAGWQVWVPYSYWLDEIISVTFSNDSWTGLFASLLDDVHPPLYQSLLKLWIALSGTGETATRLLSLFFAVATIGIFILGMGGRPRSFVLPATLFLVSSGMFAFYAQETRPYALLLLLASAAAVMHAQRTDARDPREGRLLWYLVLLVLSLTHYFGWLLAVLLLLLDRFDYRESRQVYERLTLGVLMLAWPAIHVGLGSVSSRTGGNFWITSDGPLTTVAIAASGLLNPFAHLFAGLVDSGPHSAMVITLAALVAVVVAAVAAWGYAIAASYVRVRLARQAALLVAFLTLMVVIDRHTPMSTQRNYVVLIPVLALFVGGLFQSYWERYRRPVARSLLAMLLAGYGAMAAVSSAELMQERWYPQQNWKELASQVQELAVCTPHCWFLDDEVKWRVRFYPHYFESLMGEYPERVVLSLAELEDAMANQELPIIAGHAYPDRVNRLLASLPELRCWQPVQYHGQSVVLIARDLDPQSTLSSCEGSLRDR